MIKAELIHNPYLLSTLCELSHDIELELDQLYGEADHFVLH